MKERQIDWSRYGEAHKAVSARVRQRAAFNQRYLGWPKEQAAHFYYDELNRMIVNWLNNADRDTGIE